MRTAILAALLLAPGLASAAEPADPAGVARPANPHGPLVDECAVCHSPAGWAPAVISPKFDHGKFRFRLEGAHAQAACRACHASLVFASVPDDCVSCHQDAHNGELGEDCARCHTPRSFIDRGRMTRAHQVTRFPLRGAHLVTDCEACHLAPPRQGNLIFVNISSECSSCHFADYQGATDPNHQALGFAQTCDSCHSTVAFRPARFLDHDTWYFPIYSGTHRAKWSDCSDCHVNPSVRTDFSCIDGCHAHSDRAQVTALHQGVSGFVYEKQACYGCHPQGTRP